VPSPHHISAGGVSVPICTGAYPVSEYCGWTMTPYGPMWVGQPWNYSNSGYGNGYGNGHGNGHGNGYGNGYANGYGNGYGNGYEYNAGYTGFGYPQFAIFPPLPLNPPLPPTP
jgi:hypothetical protein